MNIRPRRKAHSQVESGALSDILFFLLLFFLMISTMASPEAIKLLLPQASTAKHVPTQEVISLAINDKGQYFVNGREVRFEDLEVALQEAADEKKAESIKLSIEKTKTVQDLVALMDVANKLNLNMVIATEKVKE
jgi:biopolymer transport protein ExbD